MGAVLAAVGVACMGAFAFGYHLGVVNGPLEAIAKELGFAGNQALAGLVGFGGRVVCVKWDGQVGKSGKRAWGVTSGTV